MFQNDFVVGFYNAKILRYVDANNIKIEVTFLNVAVTAICRLKGITMPSLRSGDIEKMRKAQDCITEMKKHCQVGKSVLIKIHPNEKKNYIDIYPKGIDGMSLVDYLLINGFGTITI